MTGLVTLTAYFAERERIDGRFLAEQLLDLFDERDVATSVMLRGIASFGPTNVLRGDRSLTLSEDPPVTITAVDTAARIQAVAEQAASMIGRGVLTLERSSDDLPPSGADSVRLTLYLGRRRPPGFVAVCAVLHRLGFAGAQVLLGVDGTVAGRRERARFFSRNADVPLLLSGVGTAAQAAAAVDELRKMLADPLITVQPVRVCKNDGATVAGLGEAATEYRKLTVRTSEDDQVDGRPVHRLLIRRLMAAEHASGATALRGLWGFRGAERPHGDRFFQLARQVPVSTVMIDTADHIAATYPIVDELTAQTGLVTVEDVPAAVELHSGHIRGNIRLG